MRLLAVGVVFAVVARAQLWAFVVGPVVESKSNVTADVFLKNSPAAWRTQKKEKLQNTFVSLLKLVEMMKEYVTLTATEALTTMMEEGEDIDKQATYIMNGVMSLITQQVLSKSQNKTTLLALVKEARLLGYFIKDVRRMRNKLTEYWCPSGWKVVERRFCVRKLIYSSKRTSVERICGNQRGKPFSPRSVDQVAAVSKGLNLGGREFWADVKALCRPGRAGAKVSKRLCDPSRCAVVSGGKLKSTACLGERMLLCQRPPLVSASDNQE